jgi:hypothetical protein
VAQVSPGQPELPQEWDGPAATAGA